MTFIDSSSPFLIVGGAPRVPVDAVRHMTVHASGQTAIKLAELLQDLNPALLLSVDVQAECSARRFESRQDLDEQIQTWLEQHPCSNIILSAAINDYEVVGCKTVIEGVESVFALGEKIPSGADEMHIICKRAPKLVDQLPEWGHRGGLVVFKYEASESVVSSAQVLRERVNAHIAVANSLDGGIQALVTADAVRPCSGRIELLQKLAKLCRG